jgi:phage/plasmid-like protein (TIGR03299 family)
VSPDTGKPACLGGVRLSQQRAMRDRKETMTAHITVRQNGFAEMAYVGKAPWHSLGNRVTKDAPLTVWRREAGVDWDICEAPVQFMNGEMHVFKDHKVLYRSDTNAPLSVVGRDYKVVQPEQMVSFFKTLIEQEGFTMETMGTLKGGRRFWALAETHFGDQVLEGDMMKAYLLLITSCDGSLATTAKFVSTRVVCWNTQAIALHSGSENGRTVKVRHNTTFDPNAVKGKLGLQGRQAFNAFMDRMRSLTSVKLSSEDAQNFVKGLLPVSKERAKPVEETHGFMSIMSLFKGDAKGSNLPGVRGTAWGMLNAVTEYVDHHSRARNSENRFSSALLGPGAAMKEVAETRLLEMV